MFVLYELGTGRAHSQQKGPIDNPDTVKWGVKETKLSGIWNTETLDFDPVPVNRKKSKTEFLELFTDAEFMGILTAAKLSVEVEMFIKKMDAAEFIDLAYPDTIAGINGMAAAGLLTTERAKEVLNG